MVQSRKRVSSENEESKKSKKRKQNDDTVNTVKDGSVFVDLLTTAGFRLKKNNKPNEICKEQSVFQRDLEKVLKRHPEYPEVLREFTEGLVNQIEDPVRFRWCLCSSILPPDEEIGVNGYTQDSLLRLLLGIDDIQPAVINVMLEKLAEFTCEEDNIVGGEKVNMPHLIVSQLRWLDRIINGKDLLEKLFEVISISPVDIQREMISALPEIVDDVQHSEVASRLRELLKESSELAVSVLESLGNLHLQAEHLGEVRDTVVRTLPSAQLADLPVVVKFLLQTVASYDDALEVVGEIRKNLDLKSTSELSSNSKKCSTERSAEAFIMDALKSAIRFQRVVAEAWIKCIEAVKVASDHKMLDLCVLLILHSTNYRKPVETLTRNKLRAGLLSESLVQSTINRSHAPDYVGSVLGLAEVMLRSPEPVVTYMACSLYKQAFVSFDTFCRQEMVGSLVTHIGSGVAAEVDCSLSVLAHLVQHHTQLMAPFTVFVKGVLDYLDNLSVTQIRQLYAMLSTLAFSPDVDESSMQDEMHIIIRKQLSNNNPKYKRMGVIGAIMIVKSLAKTTGSEGMSGDMYGQVINLLQLVTSSAAKCADTCALFMDELSAIVTRGDVHPKVEEWISEHVINYFQDDFVVDIDPELETSEAGFSMTSQYGLDDAEEGAIALNLFHLILRSKNTGQPHVNSRASPLCLSPTFRLLQICEKRQSEGSLEGIDALLGCPLYLPDKSVKDKLHSLSLKEKQLYCEALFLTVNWFREVINAFAAQTDPEMKGKVISRLHHITELNDILQQAIASLPKFEPPPACFDVDEVSRSPGAVVATSGKKSKAKKSNTKGKKKKEKENGSGDSDEEDVTSADSTRLEGQTDASQASQSGSAEIPAVDIAKYRPYFREFDMEVFHILHVRLISHAALDTDMHTRSEERIEMQPPQLQLLLRDLLLKLEHALPACAAKRTTFLKVKSNKTIGFSNLDQKAAKDVAETAVGLLPALCDHLEGTSAFFQMLVEDNDGVVDGPGSDSPEARVMAECLHLLLKLLLSIFSWTGFVLQENRTLLKDGLSVLATRLNAEGASSQSSLQLLVSEGMRYLEKFGASVADLSSAVTLCKLLTCIAHKTEDFQALQSNIGQMCGEFMKRDWRGADGERAKGAKHNELVQDLLKLYFVNNEDVLKVLEKLVTVAVPELMETDKNGCSNSFPTLTRSTFAVFYRTMLNELVNNVKSISTGRRTDSDQVKMERLLRWSMAVKIFHGLVTLVKVFEARSNLNAVLKNGRVFVDAFLRQAMPLVDDLFRTHKDDITGLLKNLQICTRSLHHMCGHSKIIKDVSLTNQVPLVKKCLEMFVYRVKACLSLNNCLEAFWLGNLKNRDLKGEEIVQVSQVSTADTTGAGDSDDNLPSDVSDDEQVSVESDHGDDEKETEESYSEQF